MITKYTLLLLLAAAVYYIYLTYVKPYRFKQRYQKYPNVYVDPKHNALLGSGDKVYYYHMIELSEKCKDYDMRVSIDGIVPSIFFTSCEAIKQFSDLQPRGIDRHPDTIGIGKIFPTAIVNLTDIKERKKKYMQILSLNSASIYIPRMVKCMSNKIETWKVGESYDCAMEMNFVTFCIFTSILFGKDTQTIALDSKNKLDYINAEGKIEQLEFRPFFGRVFMDFVMEYYNPISWVLPIVNKLCLIQPFKRDRQNCATFKKFLGEILMKTSDSESAYNKGLNLLDDLILFMIGGSDTTSYTMTSILFFLKKYPESETKLLKELESYGITPG